MPSKRLKIIPKRRKKNRFPVYLFGWIRPVVKMLAFFVLGTAILFSGNQAGINFRPKIIVDANSKGKKVSRNLYGYSIDSEFQYDEKLLAAAKNTGARTFKMIQGIDRGERFLAKVENGDYKILAADSIPYYPGQEYKIKAEIKNNNIKIFIDDNLIFDVKDDTFSTGEASLLSLYNQEVAFDDVVVRNLDNNEMIFNDDFNSWLNNNWNNADWPEWLDQGDWYLKDGKYQHNGKQSLAIKTTGDKAWKNYSFEVKAKTLSHYPYDQGFMGIGFCQNGVYNAYRFLWRSKQRQPVFSARPWSVADFEGQIKFVKDSDFEPIVTVNMRGNADDAADLVKRLNLVEGLGVKYWELGNETYMLGDGFMPADVYAKKVKEFSLAMKRVDSSIKVGANIILSFGDWEEKLFKEAGNDIDFVIFHFYPFWVDSNISNTQLLASSHAFSYDYQTSFGRGMGVVKRTKELLKKNAPKRYKKIKFFITEYNIGDYEKGMSMIYGLTVADLIGQMVENNVKLSQFHKLWAEDGYQWGAYTQNYQPKPAALAIEMHAKHFGKKILNTFVVQSPKFSNSAKRNVPRMTNVPYLTAYSSRANNKKKLYLIVINKHGVASLTSDVFINNAIINPKAKVYTMNSTTIMSSNIGDQMNVLIGESDINNASNHIIYNFPAHSVTAFEFDIKVKKTSKNWGGKYLRKK